MGFAYLTCLIAVPSAITWLAWDWKHRDRLAETDRRYARKNRYL